MATADPFANPPWEGNNAHLPTHPSPTASQSFQSSAALSISADEKAIESGAPYAAAPTYIAPATTAPRPGLKERLGGIMSPNRQYLGRSRRTVLLGALGLLALLVLVLGLGLGLGLKKAEGDSAALPLPGNATPHMGDLTYYSPGPGFGSCGLENSSSDPICAVSHLLYDAASISGNPNENPLCGRKLRVTHTDARDGKTRSVDVKVVDRCTGCKATDIDLSPGMFLKLAAEEEGRVVGTWAWLD
ncbi:hypothetical protein VC83_06480 [Pseudogymnoascus destructans]|uniref:Uncharacterized protein n=2 Tax=Pseudogymnoascus destructans TaxID=655981 RepID=L8GAE1_PSED2|nr:uncharacterized protein VC83_06480 [Pseudogymnoascus destructans]ELR09869.1 hypothetical protein GMDG_04349 [Pseudogymnoascus destructans 20631-21]OAF58365.1 hypothetical protein VC83_06480 [Pseudogymnoascus destructans]